MTDAPQLSATVLFRPADGRDAAADDLVAARHTDLAPDPAGVEQVRHELEDAGFALGPADAIGLTLAIGGDAPTFERVFGAAVAVPGDELPLDGLSSTARRHVQSVSWSRLPDFGPTAFA